MPIPAIENIDLTDFRAGIYGDYHGGVAETSRGMVAGNGAAVIEGTYRCCADPTGALVPLPKGVSTGITGNQTQQLLPAGNANGTTAYYGYTPEIANHLHDAVLVTGQAGSPTVYNSVTVFTLYSYRYDSTGTSTGATNKLQSYIQGLSGTGHDWLFEFDDTMQGVVVPVTLRTGTLGLHTSNYYAIPSAYTYFPGVFATINHRSAATNRVSPTIAAPQTGFTTYDADFADYPLGIVNASAYRRGFLYFTPDPATPTTTYSRWVYDKAEKPPAPTYALTHQGRIVVLTYESAASSGTQYGVIQRVMYTAAGDPKEIATTPPSGVGFTTLYGEENNSETGVMASVTGTELLIVRHTGGGYLVQGDLAAPTVVRLPFIESTYGIVSHPAVTPLGVVYGTRNGVYVWSGGDTSAPLSNQIDGFFWDTSLTTQTIIGPRGRFDYFSPWVCVPNNYVYDTRTKSWWRLDRPADAANDVPFSVYRVDANLGNLYAFPARLTPTQNATFVHYSSKVLAGSYSWRSQPLVETRERMRTFKEITLTASSGANTAVHTVTVTLTGSNADGTVVTPAVTTFTFTGNANALPVIIRKTITPNFQAMYVQVQIEVSAAAGAAAKIIGCRIGTEDRQMNKAAN